MDNNVVNAPEKKKDGLIAAILSLVFCATGPFGIIFGCAALSNSKKCAVDGVVTGKAKVAKILGILGLICSILLTLVYIAFVALIVMGVMSTM